MTNRRFFPASLAVAVAIGLLLAASAATAQGAEKTSATEARLAELEERALQLEKAHLWRSAIDVNLEILKLDAGNLAAMNTIAGLHGTLGEFDEEIVWARKVLEIDPRFELAYVNYGNALAARGRVEEARAAFEKAGELAPTDPLPLYSQGVLAEQQGQLE